MSVSSRHSRDRPSGNAASRGGGRMAGSPGSHEFLLNVFQQTDASVSTVNIYVYVSKYSSQSRDANMFSLHFLQ